MTKIYKVEMRVEGTNCIVYVDAESVADAVALATDNDKKFKVVRVSCQTLTTKRKGNKNMTAEMILLVTYVALGTPLLIAMGYCLYDWFIRQERKICCI